MRSPLSDLKPLPRTPEILTVGPAFLLRAKAFEPERAVRRESAAAPTCRLCGAKYQARPGESECDGQGLCRRCEWRPRHLAPRTDGTNGNGHGTAEHTAPAEEAPAPDAAEEIPRRAQGAG